MLTKEKFDKILADINGNTEEARKEFRKRIKHELYDDNKKSAFGDVAGYEGSPLSYAAKIINGEDPIK